MSVQEMCDRAAEQYDAIVARTQYIGPSWLDRQLAAIGSASQEIPHAVDLGCANDARRIHSLDEHFTLGADTTVSFVARVPLAGG